ncbi:MAG: PQQ-dependent sugar dehydrogenase [Pseudomonadota bacterium]
MYGPYRSTGLGLLGLISVSLTACLEPQPTPDIATLPSDAFTLDQVVDGLERPWAVEPLGQQAYLITGKLGTLWLVEAGEIREIAGLPDSLTRLRNQRMATEGQGGLLDIAIAPDFAQTGDIYMSYSYGDWSTNGTALMRAQLDGDRMVNAATIFEASFPKEAGSHYGGRILFSDNNTLLLSLGDGFALREEAQKTGSHLGSIVRLDRNGNAPSDNPDFGESAEPELFTIGHRNVQGLAQDAQTGAIWAHEHGPRGGDELNRIEAGKNYGWPIVTEGRDYQGARISPDESDPRFAPPVHGWTPSIAPSGLVIYRGDMFSDWDGDALSGGLASGDIRHVDLDTGVETALLGDLKSETDAFRVRDLAVDDDGALLVLIEDTDNGRLIRMTPQD